jgi:hypothetical protein
MAGRLGAELHAEGAGGAVELGLGGAGVVGFDRAREQFGEGGVVAGGQAELDLAVGAASSRLTGTPRSATWR